MLLKMDSKSEKPRSSASGKVRSVPFPPPHIWTEEENRSFLQLLCGNEEELA